MEWARLVLDYIDTLAWPLVVVSLVVFFALRFSENFGNLIDRIQSATGPGGFGLSFGEKVLALQARADEADLPAAPPDEEIAEQAAIQWTPVDNFQGIILNAWLRVENALIDLADALDLEPKTSVTRIFNELERRELVDPETAEIFRKARELRNEAVHSRDPLIDRVIVKAYVGMTRQLVAWLQTVEKSANITEESAGQGETQQPDE